MIKKVLILATLFISIPFLTDAKNLYVNNSGSPACSDSTTYAANSASSPWCSIIRATWGRTDGNRASAANPSQAAQAGDTIFVTSGTYHYASAWTGGGWTESLYETANNGTSGNWITIQSTGGQSTITSNTSGQHSIIGGKQYVKWDGFIFNQVNIGWRRGNAVIVLSHSNQTVENCEIIGAYIDYGDDNNHAGIFVSGAGSHPCSAANSNITIKNNKIRGFVGNNGRNDAGITMYCNNQTTIENNEIYNNFTGIYYKSSYIDSGQTSYVRYNFFHNNSGDSIALQSWSRWHIYQNIFDESGSGGFCWFAQMYHVASNMPNATYIVNNTFYNSTWKTWYWKTHEPGTNDNHVYNNIFYGSGGAIFSESVTTTQMLPSIIRFNYNLWYGHSGSFIQNATGSYTFANWQSATFGNQDANGSSGVNPLFVDAANNNFKLQSGSPARTLGRTITAIHGSSGQTIPAGAYITGNEVIGVTSIGSPRGLQIIPE